MVPNKILLFGGTFDPIHNAHIALCRTVAAKLDIPQVFLIPAAQPPHKQLIELTPAPLRLQMVRLAVENAPLFHVSDCELQRSGPSYTLLTVQYFREQYPAAQLYWLIGQDMLADLPTWHRVEEVVQHCQMVAVRRPDCPPIDWSALLQKLDSTAVKAIRDHLLDTPLFDISATDIRRRLRVHLPVDHLIAPAVLDFIRANSLYGLRRPQGQSS